MKLVSVPVSASAYPKAHWRKGADAPILTHAVELRDDGDFERVLCASVKLASLLPDSSQYDLVPVSCPTCARRMAALKAPGTLAKVNAAIGAAGLSAELVRDASGYHYFTGDDIPSGLSGGIYVYRTAEKTIQGWIDEARALKAQRDAAKTVEPVGRLVLRS